MAVAMDRVSCCARSVVRAGVASEPASSARGHHDLGVSRPVTTKSVSRERQAMQWNRSSRSGVSPWPPATRPRRSASARRSETRNSRMLMDAYLRPFLPGIAPIAVALSAALAIINARCTAALRAACHPCHAHRSERTPDDGLGSRDDAGYTRDRKPPS